MSAISDIVEMCADGDEERNLLHHVRGNAHLSTKCPLCKAEGLAFANRLRIEHLVEGKPLPAWVLTMHPLPSDRREKPKGISLREAVDAFYEAVPRPTFDWTKREYNGPRIRVVKWIREQDAIPPLNDIAQRWTAERDGWF